MILSDVDLLRQLEKEDDGLVVEPLKDIDQQVQPASIDMRLGNKFITFNRTNITCIHPDNKDEIERYTEKKTVSPNEEFVLHPGDFVLAETEEWIEVPDDLVASVEGRSSLGRLAVVVHATAGWIDSGFRGHVTLELSNLGVAPVALTPGMRVAQLVVQTLKTPCKRPYGSDRDSKYQDQTEPTPSQIKQDTEFRD
jgi:dCTP deaminase